MSTTALNQLISNVLSDTETEVARQMQICNACRYCESYCAVFPAMTRRLDFTKDDIHYLANLCHNCGACYHACQYAPPHEFAVNVPQAMAKVRVQTYADYAWPPALGALYQRNGLVVSLALAGGLALFLLLAVLSKGSLWHVPLAGNFYAIFPHNLLVALFGSVFGFSVLALCLGVARFWRAQRPTVDLKASKPLALKDKLEAASKLIASAKLEATRDALTLKYLGGGHGEGCNNADDAWTQWRKRFHHFTMYGFALCFASTSVATLYHYFLGLKAPYALGSLPVVLGILGGIGLLIGPAGLFWLKTQRHPQHGDAAQNPMDYGFIALLFFTSLTGLALMLWRDTGAMALLLAVHLGVVMALFLTMPYGKMAHGFYRCAALLKFAIEKRLPTNLKLTAD
jgi:citrate/tricarballylate utilization protein